VAPRTPDGEQIHARRRVPFLDVFCTGICHDYYTGICHDYYTKIYPNHFCQCQQMARDLIHKCFDSRAATVMATDNGILKVWLVANLHAYLNPLKGGVSAGVGTLHAAVEELNS
jgi:hypothetical protein